MNSTENASAVLLMQNVGEETTKLTLPDELCVAIASNLREEDVQKLYLVNCSFLSLALDARYREIQLFPDLSWSFEKQARYLQHLAEDHISFRIQKLSIDSVFVNQFEPERTTATLSSRSLRRSLLSKIKTRLAPDSRPSSWPSSCQILSELVKALTPKLFNLRAVSLKSNKDMKPFWISLVHDVLASQFDTPNLENMTVRCLSLQLSPARFDRLFPDISRARIPLSRLTRLDLKISLSYNLDMSGFLRLLPADGAENPCPQLRCLSIGFIDYQREGHQSYHELFNSLSAASVGTSTNPPESPPFPHLTHFSLTEALIPFYSSVVRFLTLQRSTITHFRTSQQFLIASESDQPPFMPTHTCCVPPPLDALKYLELADPHQFKHGPGYVTDTLRSYLSRCTSLNLRTLVVDAQYAMTFQSLVHFLNPKHLRHHPDSPSTSQFKESLTRIERLSLTFVTLSPSHLILLSKCFRNLRSLSINILAKVSQGPFRPSSGLDFDGVTEPGLLSWPAPMYIHLPGRNLPTSKDDCKLLGTGFCSGLLEASERGDFEGWNSEVGDGLKELAIYVNAAPGDVWCSDLHDMIQNALTGAFLEARIEIICSPLSLFTMTDSFNSFQF